MSLKSSELHDGIRPKQACCVDCGYRFGGVAIKGGVITCPECGAENEFDFKPINRSRFIWLGALRISLFLMDGIAMVLALLWLTGAATLFKKAMGR